MTRYGSSYQVFEARSASTKNFFCSSRIPFWGNGGRILAIRSSPTCARPGLQVASAFTMERSFGQRRTALRATAEQLLFSKLTLSPRSRTTKLQLQPSDQNGMRQTWEHIRS